SRLYRIVGSSSSRRCMAALRSEEHTSELQSLRHLVCRLLLEKKKICFSKASNSSIAVAYISYARRTGPHGFRHTLLLPKVFVTYVVVVDNVDLNEATELGDVVTNTPGVLTETTADLAWSFFMVTPRPPSSTLFPYTTLFRSDPGCTESSGLLPPGGAWPR